MHASELKLWIRSSILGLIMIGLCYVYYGLQTSIWTIFTFNKSLAATAIIMVNLSFVVSGTAYFWGIGKTKMGYRKSVGVVGFVIGLIHASTSAWLYTGSVFWKDLVQQYPVPNVPAALAIVIFTMMVAVSNWGMPKRLGPVLWRKLLRVGYIAIFLIVIHMSLHSLNTWSAWFNSFDPLLPPMSLLLFVFSLFTLLLRVALYFALKKRKNNSTSTPTPGSQSATTSPSSVTS